MLFVVNRHRLQRMIALTRDDRRPEQQGDHVGPFFRIEASGERLRLTGRQVEATFPATVYEPGVLFLRVTVFRRLLGTFKGVHVVAIQVNQDGMFLDNIHLSLDALDMLLYPDTATAPMVHPLERLEPDDPLPVPVKEPEPEGYGPLFEGVDSPLDHDRNNPQAPDKG